MKYDLENRTFAFAGKIRKLIKSIPKNTIAYSDQDQLIRSSGSVAANYIEANEALSGKDFMMRIKICRKEAKESQLWLSLIKRQAGDSFIQDIDYLSDEAHQLVKIFNTIVYKTKLTNSQMTKRLN